jgi:hypothetical protein
MARKFGVALKFRGQMDVCPTGFKAAPSSPRLDMVPIGGIIMWSGSVGNIPPGYQLCDGTNATPDMQDKFCVGAGSAYPPASEGGSSSHVHAPGFTVLVADGFGESVWCGDNTAAGSTLPPFLALVYIQRMA